ncbi:unnamed protein product [Coregonus sp. 'balchen']|nr:unnamed protein product [Coregonus sp. 'balchen']
MDVPCSSLSTQPVLLPVTFPDYPGPPLSPALVDSGAAGNFLDQSVALLLRIPLVPSQPPIPVHALDNRSLGTGLVRQTTIPISLTVNHNHHERITFLILVSPAHPRSFSCITPVYRGQIGGCWVGRRGGVSQCQSVPPP